MAGLAHLTLKIPKDVHKKLKIMSIVKEKSMTDLLIEMIDTAQVEPVTFDKVKPAPVVVGDAIPVDRGDLVNRILAMQQDGKTMAEIAWVLKGMEVPTPSGKSEWNKSTVANLLRGVKKEVES